MVSQVQAALPGILALTNKISAVLDNAANITSNLNTTIVDAQPLVTNFAVISGECATGRPDGLGARHEWQRSDPNRLDEREFVAAHMDTNLTAILIHLADITEQPECAGAGNPNIV